MEILSFGLFDIYIPLTNTNTHTHIFLYSFFFSRLFYHFFVAAAAATALIFQRILFGKMVKSEREERKTKKARTWIEKEFSNFFRSAVAAA